MKYSTCEVHGLFGFRHVDLDVVATVQFGEDYLDLSDLHVFSSRRNCMVAASDRLLTAFQEKHWDALQEKCDDHARAQAEIYRDTLDEIGCQKASERMEREAERRCAA